MAADDEGRAGAVRDRLLDAAMEVASKQGFEACGPREFAARAEVSSAMVADPWLPELIVREVLYARRIGIARFFRQGHWRLAPHVAGSLARRRTRAAGAAIGLRSAYDGHDDHQFSAFPYLMLPIVGAEIDLEIDADFPNRLILHNQKLLSLGLRARSEEEP